MATDLGFCPKCGHEVDGLIEEDEVRALLDSYDEDVGRALAEIKGQGGRD